MEPVSGKSRSTDEDVISLIREVLRAAFVAVLPAIVFFAVGARSIEPINGQDGYAYIGIVARTEDFLTRFPDSYFGMRFGYLFPTELFTRLFGFEIGHHVLRFVLLGSVALAFSIHKRLSFTATLVSVALFSFSPIVLVSTYNTYPMAIGALSLLLGTLVFSQSTPSETRLRLLTDSSVSAAFFAIAWNCHLQLLVPSAVVFGIMAADRLKSQSHDRTRTFAVLVAGGLLGTVIVCGIGVMILGLRYGLWNPWLAGYRFASTTTSTAFESSGFEWITWRHYALVAPLAVAVSAATWMTEGDLHRRHVLRRMTLAVVGLLIVYAFYQWGLKSIALETFYQSSGLFVVATASMAYAIGVLIDRLNKQSLVGVITVAASLGTYFVGSSIEASFIAVFTTAAVVGLVVTFLIIRPNRLLGLSLILAVAAVSWATVSSPHDFPSTKGGYRTDPLYDQALFSYDRASMDRASVVDKISRMIPAYPKLPGDLRVWFNPSPPFDQLSGPFLWYRSSLQGMADPALPNLTPTIEQNLRVNSPTYVVIVDGDRDKVSAGVEQVQLVSDYDLLWMRSVSDSTFVAHVAVLKYSGPDS